MSNSALEIINEVKQVIVGKDTVIAKVLAVILAGGHILLEDVPGVGKTTLALAFSRSMSLECKRIQFTPDTMASDISGYSVINKISGELEFKKGAAFCNLLLADEINRTSAKTQAALLEVMEEQSATVDGITHRLPNPFICIATQNPIGAAGTQNLPDSQLDRFMARLSMGYPSTASQIEIIKARVTNDPIDSLKPIVNAGELLAMRQAVQAVYANDDIISYAVALCEATRVHNSVEQGVSPRAALALMQLAKAWAYLANRAYVIPDDIRAVFADVCAHRLILKPFARIKNENAYSVLEEISASCPAPAIGK